MPPLGVLSQSSRPAPVFGPPQEFGPSSLGQRGRKNVFEVHAPDSNRIALLKNGDESFAARVQLLEAADDAVNEACAAALVLNAQARGPGQDLGEIDVRRIMNQLDFKFVGFVDFFGSGEGVDPEV